MTMAMGVLVCFNCCLTEQPQPKGRRRIDRSMIGEPTNFRHTAHVGSGDIGLTPNSSSNSLTNIQGQMSSKGEVYDTASPVAVHLNVIDLPVRNNS